MKINIRFVLLSSVLFFATSSFGDSTFLYTGQVDTSRDHIMINQSPGLSDGSVNTVGLQFNGPVIFVRGNTFETDQTLGTKATPNGSNGWYGTADISHSISLSGCAPPPNQYNRAISSTEYTVDSTNTVLCQKCLNMATGTDFGYFCANYSGGCDALPPCGTGYTQYSYSACAGRRVAGTNNIKWTNCN